jgi:hypothetical protein
MVCDREICVRYFRDNCTFTYLLMCRPLSESVPTVGKGKDKGKFHPGSGHEGPERYSSTLSLICSYSITNKMHLLSQIIYFCKTLYMFRTVFPSIIRSSKLRIQQRYMSNSCCYLLLSGMRWNWSSLRHE